MTRCPFDGKTLEVASSNVVITGKGWERGEALREELVCPVCKFRARIEYIIMDLGEQRRYTRGEIYGRQSTL